MSGAGSTDGHGALRCPSPSLMPGTLVNGHRIVGGGDNGSTLFYCWVSSPSFPGGRNVDLIEDRNTTRRPPLEDLRRTPLGRIDRQRAAEVARGEARDGQDHGRIDSALFGSSI